MDRLAAILAQRGSGALAFLGKEDAAGDSDDPDLFAVDRAGRMLFGDAMTASDGRSPPGTR